VKWSTAEEAAREDGHLLLEKHHREGNLAEDILEKSVQAD
jgi:hypothetical protein